MRCFVEASGPSVVSTPWEKCDREATYYRIGFEKSFRKAEPVCSEHAERFYGRLGWAVRTEEDLLRHKMTMEAWEAEVQRVCLAVAEAWPDQAASIFPTMRAMSDHYSFDRWGMYVGVEPDGYIHT